MNRNIFRLLSIAVLLWTAIQSDAQISTRSRRLPPEKKVTTFTDHLWYGGGFGLSFSGGSGNVAGSTFSVGLSPMIGYKLNNVFSVGPRFEFQYTNGRFQAAPGYPVVKFNGFDYGAGVFARAKFVRILFAQVEYSYISREYPKEFNATFDKITTERLGNDQFLVGLGYTSGYLFSSEISLMYDLLAPKNTTQLPLVYRLGFTYKF